MTTKTFKVQQQNCLHKTKLSTIWNNFQFKVQIETINLIYFLQSFVILYCIILNKQNKRNLVIRFMSIKTLIGSSTRIYLSFSFFSFFFFCQLFCFCQGSNTPCFTSNLNLLQHSHPFHTYRKFSKKLTFLTP